MDNFLLDFLAHELAGLIRPDSGARLGKMYVLGAHSIGLDLRLSDGRVLVMSAAPNDGRFYLTDRHPRELEDRATPDPPFVQRLRKEFGGARLVRVSKPSTERSVTLTFTGYDALGASRTMLLRLDLTGRTSNLYWLDGEGCVVDLLRPTPNVIVGTRHDLPRQTATLEWNNLSSGDLIGVTPETVEEFLRRDVAGCGAIRAREVALLAARMPVGAAVEAVQTLLTDKPKPVTAFRRPPADPDFDARRDAWFSPFPLEQFAGWSLTAHPSLHAAAAEVYTLIDRHAAFVARVHPWRTALATHLKRLSAAQEKIAAERASHDGAELQKKYGELIYANIATGKRTETGLVVIDYYEPDQPEIEIPVDSSEELSEAAQRYFRKYQKAQRAAVALAEREIALADQTARAEAAVEALAGATTDESLAAIVPVLARALPAELRPRTESPATKATRKAKKKDSDWNGLRHYRGPDGYEIFVGRTDRDNDRLTFKLARSFDLWLHAADYPGAHVVIRNTSKGAIPQHVVHAAAELAAFFSQAKQADKVAVHYAERKRLTRPRNGAPGQVLMTENKTIMVAPREVLERVFA